jgi:hypothetical protein
MARLVGYCECVAVGLRENLGFMAGFVIFKALDEVVHVALQAALRPVGCIRTASVVGGWVPAPRARNCPCYEPPRCVGNNAE